MQGDESDDDGWDPLDGIMEEVGTAGAQCRHAGSSSSVDRAQMVLQEPADQQKPFDEFEYERLDDEAERERRDWLAGRTSRMTQHQ